MAIDTSIYQNIRPVETPNILDSATKALSLSQLGMHNQQMQLQMATQQAVRQAYAKNTDASGRLDQPGFLSDLGKINPQAAMEYQGQLSKLGKEGADAQSSQAEAYQKRASIAARAMDYVSNLPPELQEQGYNHMVDHLVKSGVASAQQFPEYSPETLKGLVVRSQQFMGKNSKDYLADEKTKAEIANTQAEAALKQGGQRMRPEQTDRLSSSNAALGIIKDLRDAMGVNTSEIGPVKGFIASKNKWDSRGQMYNAMTEKATQLIGSALQHGVLDAASFRKYQAMMPQMTDTPEVAAGKIDQIERLVQHQRNADIETYGKAGYNVRQFDPSALTDLAITKPETPQKGAGGGMVRSAYAAPPIKPGTVEDGYVFMGGDPGSQKNWKKR